jgi:hypothetical protein
MADGRCEFGNDRREGLRGNHRCAFHVDATDGDAVNGAHISPHEQDWPHDLRMRQLASTIGTTIISSFSRSACPCAGFL